MNSKIEVKPYIGDTAYGPTYDTSINNVDAYVEQTSELIMDDEGNEVVANYLAIIRDNINCPNNSLVIYNAKEYKTVKSAKYTPLGRFSHLEVYLL